jgi:hypothetical protein
MDHDHRCGRASENLCYGRRRDGKSVEAVRGVSFEVRGGERLAFIGPNGAHLHCLSTRRSHRPLQPNRRRPIRPRRPRLANVSRRPPPLHLRLLLDPCVAPLHVVERQVQTPAASPRSGT